MLQECQRTQMCDSILQEEPQQYATGLRIDDFRFSGGFCMALNVVNPLAKVTRIAYASRPSDCEVADIYAKVRRNTELISDIHQ